MITVLDLANRPFLLIAGRQRENAGVRLRRWKIYIPGEISPVAHARPSVLLVLSLGSPILATVVACSDDRALGGAPASGSSECRTLCRTLGLLTALLFWLGLRSRWRR